MKKSLLEIVQSILSSLDGEVVNSITDTVESIQIAGYVQNSYEELIAGLNLPQQYRLFELEPSSDITKPVVMYKPENVANILWLKYNKSDTYSPYLDYQDLTYLEPELFIRQMYQWNSDINDTGKMVLTDTYGNFTFYYKTDKSPDYYTTFDDKTLIFDSFNISVESTLQGTKSSGYGEVSAVFQMEDDYVLNLTDNEFALLENEAKAQAFVEQKQTQNPTAEKRARKGWIRTQREKVTINTQRNFALNTNVNYGKQGHIGYGKLRNGW